MVVWFGASMDRRRLMCNDLVIEGIYKERPLPTPAVAIEYRHIGYHDFNRTGCVPVSLDFVRKHYVFRSCLLIGEFPRFGADTGLLAAFVCQIVGEHPTRSFKYRFGKHVITMRGMLFVLLHQTVSSGVVYPVRSDSVSRDGLSTCNSLTC